MRSIRGITAIIFCFVLLCIVPLAGAEETDYSDYSGYSDVASVSEDWGEQEYGMSSNYGLEDLLGEELISNIIQFLLRLFLSLFSGSMY